MKIVSTSFVKNESDIIESFIRYQLNLVDEMIILDNFSTDNTPEIIDNLIDEGLPIHLIRDTNTFDSLDIKMTKMVHKAVNEHDADLVCLLDCDEFIFSTNGKHPREVLESLDHSKFHLIKWRTFVPSPEDDYDIKFIPKRINHIRDESFETFYKVIVPSEIIKNNNVTVDMGNHNITIKHKNRDKFANYDLDLKLAHFPIRSKEQCMSKVIIGWVNTIASNVNDEGWNGHWRDMFYKIKADNDISSDDLQSFAKEYSLIPEYKNNLDNLNISIKKEPMNLEFCENIEIKYYNKFNFLNNILENDISLAEDVVSLKKEINVLKGKTSMVKLLQRKIYEKFIK